MKVEKVALEDLSLFSSLFIDYITNNSKLKSFYDYAPTMEGLNAQLKRRSFASETRAIVASDLLAQYQEAGITDMPLDAIELIRNDNTYTFTTGHQLSIFSGPLYMIYKILTVINMAEEMKKKHPESNFVPVFWMATEDHDYEEIKSFRMFNRKHIWEWEQEHYGPSGAFPTQQLAEMAEQIADMPTLFQEAYKNGQNLAHAVRLYMHELFKEYGLLIIDADRPALKAVLKPVIKADLEEHTTFEYAQKQSELMQAEAYKAQAYPRPINFFYIPEDKSFRKRIEREGDGYTVVDTDISFTKDEMAELIASKPELFSPNVILRPLYQEMILPNIAYTGGPGELAYWLQLKTVFEHYKVDFPVLLPRVFATILEAKSAQKLDQMGLTYTDLFQEYDVLKKTFVKENLGAAFSVEQEIADIQHLLTSIATKASQIEEGLGKSVAGEGNKVMKQVERFETKMRKAEERKNEQQLKQLERLHQKVRPNGGLQERVENVLSFYINRPQIIHELKMNLNPLDLRMNMITLD